MTDEITLPRKSTPLSEGKCPDASILIGDHAVSKTGDGEYECNCGCLFQWQDQMHYKVLEHGTNAPNPNAPEADFVPETPNGTGNVPGGQEEVTDLP